MICGIVSKNIFRNIVRMSKSFDPDQARHFIRPVLGPNCLQQLSAGDSSKQISSFLMHQSYIEVLI